MVDPASIAIGGAAGKFVDKAWNLGEKWISRGKWPKNPERRF